MRARALAGAAQERREGRHAPHLDNGPLPLDDVGRRLAVFLAAREVEQDQSGHLLVVLLAVFVAILVLILILILCATGIHPIYNFIYLTIIQEIFGYSLTYTVSGVFLYPMPGGRGM